MQWFILVLAGLLEIGWAVGLKYTDGFSRLWPSVFTAVAIMLSLGLLSLAVKDLPVGTAYAVWMGIGTAGTVMFGIVFFGESAGFLRLASVALILLGVIGLKLATP